MNQFAVLRYCYDSVFEILKREGESSGLYTVAEYSVTEKMKTKKSTVYIRISDLCQISQDKNGEKVFIDEQQFPAPTFMAFIFTIEISAQQYQDALETAGFIVHHFKDNNSFDAGEYNWHGNKNDAMYMEPIIREPEINRMRNNLAEASVFLEYRIEAAINSEKGGVFKRVQSRDIKAVNK
jgi:hypothetical protein